MKSVHESIENVIKLVDFFSYKIIVIIGRHNAQREKKEVLMTASVNTSDINLIFVSGKTILVKFKL